MQAALFTAIVTSFVLDSMTELEEDTTTRILRILVARSNITTEDLQPSNPPSSIVYVNALWFLSITLSLGASTWAMLCKEWCGFHLQGRQPKDYTEMATKRQRSLQAIEKWKMELLVMSIPFALHLALFLFFVGLWLRLTDKDPVLGFVVGIPALLIAATYVISTLLPVFTDAPFHTSASGLIKYVLKRPRRPRFPRILLPPVLSFISVFSRGQPSQNLDAPPSGSSLSGKYRNVKRISRHLTFLTISALKRVYKRSAPLILPIWRGILTFLPQFKFEEDGPLEELNWLTIVHPEQSLEWRAKALFWLLRMPLEPQDVRDLLQELNKIISDNGYAPDPQSVESLVLCLSSVLSDGHISLDERPVTMHCLRVLAKALDRAFFVSKRREFIILKNDTVAGLLGELFFDEAPSLLGDRRGWEDMIVSLWFCPTPGRIRMVVEALDSGADGIGEDLLMQAVHGLHAAMLNWLKSGSSITELPIPDFSRWLDRKAQRNSLDDEILAYLHDLFGALCQPSGPSKTTAPLPNLMIESLRLLDGSKNTSSTLLNALCTFIIVGWKVSPGSLDTSPSVADAILASIEAELPPTPIIEGTPEQPTPITEDTLVRLVIKLDAIAYGPALTIRKDRLPLTALGAVFDRVTSKCGGDAKGLTDFVRRFLDAHTSTMENTSPMFTPMIENMFSMYTHAWNVLRYWNKDVESSIKVLSDPNIFKVAQENPEYRLPFLYSLTIAFSYARGARPIVQTISRVGELFITTDGDDDHVDRAMDTNFFAAAVLRQVMGHRPLTDSEAEAVLSWLKRKLFVGASRNIRWKGIFLLAELANIVDNIQSKTTYVDIKQSMEQFITDRMTTGEPFADPDWGQRKRELGLCGLKQAMKSIPSSLLLDRGVYDWKDGIPLLSLYPHYSSLDPGDRALYKFLTNLQGFVSLYEVLPGFSLTTPYFAVLSRSLLTLSKYLLVLSRSLLLLSRSLLTRQMTKYLAPPVTCPSLPWKFEGF